MLTRMIVCFLEDILFSVVHFCCSFVIQYTLERRKKHRKTDKAVLHYNRTVCKKMIAMWLHYVDTQRAIKQQVDLKYRTKCHIALG